MKPDVSDLLRKLLLAHVIGPVVAIVELEEYQFQFLLISIFFHQKGKELG